MVERVVLPQELEEMPPGPALAAALAGIDRDRLNGFDLVVLMQARARQIAHEQPQLLADAVAVAHCPPGHADSPVARTKDFAAYAADEIRVALTWTRRAAVERLPAVHTALMSGAIDLPAPGYWPTASAPSTTPSPAASSTPSSPPRPG